MKTNQWFLGLFLLGCAPAAKTAQGGEACTEKLAGLVFQAASCKELQRQVDDELAKDPACVAFFPDGGTFDVCEKLRQRRKDGGPDVQN